MKTTTDNTPNGFNETVSELRKNLSFCFQAPDGKIYWYKGTIDLVFKLLSYLTAGRSVFLKEGETHEEEEE